MINTARELESQATNDDINDASPVSRMQVRYNQDVDEASPKRVKALDLQQCSQLRGNSLDTEPTTMRAAEPSSQRQQLQEVKAMEKDTASLFTGVIDRQTRFG